jgi:putative ABC transport system ATP-binding protein
MTVLEVNALSHRYGNATVVEMPAWSVEAGEPWLLLGASGSGKTTLLHCLAGILVPTQGSVKVGGTELGSLHGSALDRFRGRHIGLLPQRLHLIDCLSVIDNLLLAQYAAGLPRDAAAARGALEALGLAGRAHERPHRLSFGQQQRVALARALINRPTLVLADEPTSNLDDANCSAALDLLLDQASRSGAALVIATHDQRVKGRIERRVELVGGKAVAGMDLAVGQVVPA